MKKECPNSMKFKLLKARLQMPACYIIGVLDALWMFTARDAPAGDIGRWDDNAIAMALDLPRSEWESLKHILIDHRWIDVDPEFRLVIHDWHEHCEDSIKKKAERAAARHAENPDKHPRWVWASEIANDRRKHAADEGAQLDLFTQAQTTRTPDLSHLTMSAFVPSPAHSTSMSPSVRMAPDHERKSGAGTPTEPRAQARDDSVSSHTIHSTERFTPPGGAFQTPLRGSSPATEPRAQVRGESASHSPPLPHPPVTGGDPDLLEPVCGLGATDTSSPDPAAAPLTHTTPAELISVLNTTAPTPSLTIGAHHSAVSAFLAELKSNPDTLSDFDRAFIARHESRLRLESAGVEPRKADSLSLSCSPLRINAVIAHVGNTTGLDNPPGRIVTLLDKHSRPGERTALGNEVASINSRLGRLRGVRGSVRR